jgi:hypothetical protein
MWMFAPGEGAGRRSPGLPARWRSRRPRAGGELEARTRHQLQAPPRGHQLAPPRGQQLAPGQLALLSVPRLSLRPNQFYRLQQSPHPEY